MQFIQKGLLFIYSVVQKTGLLEQLWFKKIFWFAYFLYKRHFEDPFAGLTQKYPELFRGGYILDIGANIGYTAIVFSMAISSGFRVYAFEPDRTNFLSLREIIKAYRKVEKIVAIQAAVGEKKGTISLWHNDAHHADHRIATKAYQESGIDIKKLSTVPLWSVDSFVESELDQAAVKFIKIDVQGYELPVCLGMEKTLEANPDAVIAIEYMPASLSELGFDPLAILEFFQSKGYLRYLLTQNGILKLADIHLINELIQKRGYIDLVFSQQEIGEG